jgi:hypothetical protein
MNAGATTNQHAKIIAMPQLLAGIMPSSITGENNAANIASTATKAIVALAVPFAVAITA